MSGPGPDAPGQGKASAAGGSRARRKLLTAEEAELFELAQAAGTGLDPEVFKILLDLLRMNVAPLAIFQMLRSMCAGQRGASTETVPEPAREPPFVSAKTSKIPAPLSFSSTLRPPRIRVTKTVVYSPAAACSPLSQGCNPNHRTPTFQHGIALPFRHVLHPTVGRQSWKPCQGRTRTSSAVTGNQPLSDHNSREGSVQRVPRQPSTSRLQKTGCPGKST